MLIVRTPANTGAHALLEDLNGATPPHGLVKHFRESLGVSGAALNLRPWGDRYVAALRSLVDLWLATSRRHGVDTPSTRHPTVEISQIVDRVVSENQVLPAAGKDGYAMAIVARSKARLTGRAISTATAERAFVEMLMSAWRLKIARCATPSCGMYFQLKTWKHTYAKGTRCTHCRRGQEFLANQKRVEANRAQARQALYAFVAARFGARIRAGQPWYRDTKLKQQIAAGLNAHFRNDRLWRTHYPQGITGKWLEAGQKERKNWLLIERALAEGDGNHTSIEPFPERQERINPIPSAMPAWDRGAKRARRVNKSKMTDPT